MVWLLGLKKPGLTDQGVAIGVTKFRMASGELIEAPFFEILITLKVLAPHQQKIFSP